jgi:hypothetical protein
MRLTKAERERLKITCLWCDNEARSHMICRACMAPMNEEEQKRYVRVLPVEYYGGRVCACGKQIPEDAPPHTVSCSELCRAQHRKTQRNRRRAERVAEWRCTDCGIETVPPRCRMCQSKNTASSKRRALTRRETKQDATRVLVIMRDRPGGWRMRDLVKATALRHDRLAKAREYLLSNKQIGYNMIGRLVITQ